MELFAIISEVWKIDGGVSFGVVPKTIWEASFEADENNLVTIANRLLLIKTENRLILINTGFGSKRDHRYYKYKYIQQRNNLSEAIQQVGFSAETVTDVIFTHLHDDHCGGAVEYNEKGEVALVFPNAMHWYSEQQYKWAKHPNMREAASFFSDNWEAIEKQGKQKFVNATGIYFPDISFRLFDGHTAGQIIPFINTPKGKLVYVSDFIPSAAHVPLAYIASVDTQPLLALKEKELFLNEAVKQDYVLFFEHDYQRECCTLQQTMKGVRVKDVFSLKEWLQ